MRKFSFIFALVAFAFMCFFLSPKTAEASADDMAGTYVNVRTTWDTPIADIPVHMKTDTGGTWPYLRGPRACQGQAFINLPPYPDRFFGAVDFWTDGNGWAWSRDPAYWGQRLTGGGITYNGQFGFACNCNPLLIAVHGFKDRGWSFNSIWSPDSNARVVYKDNNIVWIALTAPQGGIPHVYVYLTPSIRGYHDPADNYDWTGIYKLSDLNANGYDASSSKKKSCQITVGWSCDLRNKDYQSVIHLYSTNEEREWGAGVRAVSTDGSLKANLFRQGYGFEGACGGNQNHGFIYKVPDWLKDGRDHWIYAYAFNIYGSGYKLASTPQKINCPPEPYTITINKNEVGNDGQPHTWKYKIQRYGIGGLWGTWETTASVTIPAGESSGSVKVTLPQRDASKDCTDSGGENCRYKVIEYDIPTKWNATRAQSEDIILNNSNRAGTVSFENTYEAPKDDLGVTLTGPEIIAFTKAEVEAENDAGRIINENFTATVSHNSNFGDKLGTKLYWKAKVLQTCDPSCGGTGDLPGNFFENNGNLDYSQLLDVSSQSAALNISFNLPAVSAYQIELTATANHNDGSESKSASHIFWVVQDKRLECTVSADKSELYVNQTLKAAVTPTYNLEAFFEITNKAGYEKPDPIDWTINWGDGRGEDGNNEETLSHTYTSTIPSGSQIKVDISGIAGFTENSCKEGIRVKSSSSSNTWPVAPSR